MVALGGTLGALPGERERQGSDEKRHPVAMANLAFMLVAIAALGVVTLTVRDEVAPVVLSQEGEAVHSLHFMSSLHPDEASKAVAYSSSSPSALTVSSSSIVGTTNNEVLSSAKLAAQNRLQTASLPKSVQDEDREELKLKRELDASVKAKEASELSDSLKSTGNMRNILEEAAAAKKAKNLKVKITNADSQSSADTSEEAALRKRLDQDVRKRQASMLRRADPALAAVRGRHEQMSVAASHLERKAGKKLSETNLEAELRNQLNSKVQAEESSMYKSAVRHWTGKGEEPVRAAGARGRSKRGVHSGAAGLLSSQKKGKHDALKLAERMMKRELSISKHSGGEDLTLKHPALNRVRKSKAAKKQDNLAQLEKAMMQSVLSKARTDEPKLHKKHEMLIKLRQAAKQKKLREKIAKPSYSSVMQKFESRLMRKEDSARQRFLQKRTGGVGVVNKQELEDVIKKKVASKLSMGNKRLQQERAQLQQQFNTAKSPFAKAERRELKELQSASAPSALDAPKVQDSWHL